MQPISLRSQAGRDTDIVRARLTAISPPARRMADSMVERDGWAAGPAEEPPTKPADQRDATPLASHSVRRWLPVVLREAQLVAPRQAAASLIAVALLSALVTAAALWLVRPRESAIGPPPLAQQAAPADPRTGAERSPSAEPATSARALVLAVVGRVRHPGLVRVPPGSRVIDAIKAAGGAQPGTDLALLNLARKVVDGEQIVVGAPAQAAGGAAQSGSESAAGRDTPVNLNSASLDELDALPGVGPVIAQRILDWRTAHGGFTRVEQLLDVPGIGDRTMEHLRSLVTV